MADFVRGLAVHAAQGAVAAGVAAGVDRLGRQAADINVVGAESGL